MLAANTKGPSDLDVRSCFTSICINAATIAIAITIVVIIVTTLDGSRRVVIADARPRFQFESDSEGFACRLEGNQPREVPWTMLIPLRFPHCGPC